MKIKRSRFFSVKKCTVLSTVVNVRGVCSALLRDVLGLTDWLLSVLKATNRFIKEC